MRHIWQGDVLVFMSLEDGDYFRFDGTDRPCQKFDNTLYHDLVSDVLVSIDELDERIVVPICRVGTLDGAIIYEDM